ncbi:hypothetical protein Nepgr_028695 [Nepenthes gracilis]|uniref:Acyl carrier protein n=1 Tax=Nepenthes gracilis TaxID=150966 RepID=A0AAD3TE79_NEPGR|nr:hypothetical protein Nepgr_028695 [Nepenthes gracilis]
MQNIKSSILRHVRITPFSHRWLLNENVNACNIYIRQLCSTVDNTSNEIMARVIRLVKRFHRIDVAKVTETADFSKDLCLDSLDKVELVMALEQEFSIEIPDDKADKLFCCADVVKYIILSADDQKALD